jgi:hypothetical protein
MDANRSVPPWDRARWSRHVCLSPRSASSFVRFNSSLVLDETYSFFLPTLQTLFHFCTFFGRAAGFGDTEATHISLSYLYTLTFTLGNSVGPSVSGALVDVADFEWASLFILSLSFLVVRVS